MLGFFYLTRRDGSVFEQFLNGRLEEQTNAEQDQKGQEDVNIHQKKKKDYKGLPESMSGIIARKNGSWNGQRVSGPFR